MSVSTDTKTCPLCAETIKAPAKVCPFCQSRQGRFALWKQDFGLLIAVLIMMGSALAPIIWLARHAERGRSFVGHQADLLVLGPSLDRAQKGDQIWLAGYITNKGFYPWRLHELEVRFLREDGSLLDARHPDLSPSFVVEPQHENAFRVGLGELSFAYSNFVPHVRVQAATDGSRDVKPD